MQVWFNGRISVSQADDMGSIPIICSTGVIKRLFDGRHTNAFCEHVLCPCRPDMGSKMRKHLAIEKLLLRGSSSWHRPEE